MKELERVQSDRFVQLDLTKFKISQYPMRRLCIQAGRAAVRRQLNSSCNSIVTNTIYSHDELIEQLRYVALNEREDQTLLILAVESGNDGSVELLLKRGREAIVKRLLQNDATAIKETNEKGQTPLYMVSEMGNRAVVKQLLEKGAASQMQTENGWEPLFRAVLKGHDAVAKLYLRKVVLMSRYGII
ncbi:hypothetical protein BBP40_006836 [Aspergillus hancockii]|nr:hypothetical protein BBP40_006836 [Aspergillus hancockii]